jgi:hypothetical protein
MLPVKKYIKCRRSRIKQNSNKYFTVDLPVNITLPPNTACLDHLHNGSCELVCNRGWAEKHHILYNVNKPC